MEMSGQQAAALQDRFSKDMRLSVAIGALDSIRDLLDLSGTGDPTSVMQNVNADNFACLLGIIVNEMRAAHEGA